ncbi:YbhB/YbcL family Raf kinase inhibitor-like protein [Celeribacter naphthalenivorans]|uniref:YbhB/YbcL family Raf kinase inhibitor-like protein n=1 Tax=Celeribacter naphthalenivorans TaxID=1614694 RepID=UPI001CFC0ECF|nr:YbhB/YbcL family Raf kinase inhibitor-like protein [Celeribacter naphthalenivorans]
MSFTLPFMRACTRACTAALSALTLSVTLSGALAAEEFQLTSQSMAEGVQLSTAQVFEGFGCTGGNRSPDLAWSGLPEGTESLALTAYDPDAPTGSGWWHWGVVNIPMETTEVPAGASGTDAMPEGALELRNDYGSPGFGGACPPPGEVHRYIFTLHALSAKLDLPEGVTNAIAGYMINSQTIATAKLTAVYTR